MPARLDRSPLGAARRLWRPAGVLALAVSAVSYVAAVDPGETGHYPACPFLALTGYECPGCGALRTIHALAHGHVRDALGLNVFAVVMIPVLVFFWVRWTSARLLDRPVRSRVADPRLIWVFLGAVLLFWVLRNLPFGSFLAA
ncbi:DUF2752 domain-containing protein [Actinomadura sp. LD22]|uniref:DUF2752 domain-containing protein n=2 Tax=Actinomadura physcomitrii TaxID=2650748 RepID=A0A6I4MCT4_9ACTN|nr:DUF2752 domain-containing protein [Actinomadura physcomitrii]